MFQLGVTTKLQHVDLIAELKKKQVSPQVREGKDGTIEDIITGTHPRQRIASDTQRHSVPLGATSEHQHAEPKHMEMSPVSHSLGLKALSHLFALWNSFLLINISPCFFFLSLMSSLPPVRPSSSCLLQL